MKKRIIPEEITVRCNSEKSKTADLVEPADSWLHRISLFSGQLRFGRKFHTYM